MQEHFPLAHMSYPGLGTSTKDTNPLIISCEVFNKNFVSHPKHLGWNYCHPRSFIVKVCAHLKRYIHIVFPVAWWPALFFPSPLHHCPQIRVDAHFRPLSYTRWTTRCALWRWALWEDFLHHCRYKVGRSGAVVQQLSVPSWCPPRVSHAFPPLLTGCKIRDVSSRRGGKAVGAGTVGHWGPMLMESTCAFWPARAQLRIHSFHLMTERCCCTHPIL